MAEYAHAYSAIFYVYSTTKTFDRLVIFAIAGQLCSPQNRLYAVAPRREL